MRLTTGEPMLDRRAGRDESELHPWETAEPWPLEDAGAVADEFGQIWATVQAGVAEVGMNDAVVAGICFATLRRTQVRS